MKNAYLINEIILFSPENCSLVHRNSYPSGKVTLHGPASECLHILLSHAQQPVTQKMLFEQVWERKGVIVSTNTLYQSIASIRKGLKAVGLEEDIIRTLPKQGFQCNATVQSGQIDEFISPPAPPITEVIPPVIEPVATTTATDNVSRNKFGYAAVLSGLITVAMAGSLFYWLNQTSLPLSPEYFSAGNVEKCTLYSSWSGEEYSQEVFNELRLRHPIDCAKKHTAYLTINRLQYGSTLMICNQPLEQESVKCRAIIFKDDEDENK
jgi:DNA-binding winged helix-turn-helix (wHTH) protein